MISKRGKSRRDGRSSAGDALRYGEGLTPDRETGEMLDKSHRTRLGNFGLVDDGVYVGQGSDEMSKLIELAAIEIQSNCDLNTRVGNDKKLAHFIVSFNQDKPSEAVLRDTEDSMLAALKLDKNHFATFLHNDNGYWHLHIFSSRIETENPHRGNDLWHDQINRDKVCREIEIRHDLQRDNGLHQVNEHGQITEIPREERRAKREAKPAGISDRAKTTEIYSGEKSFQTWVNEIRIGDRLKHAKSWQDLHAAAAAYGCEVKTKGAGFVICPAGEKGGIQLSKVGLKNISAKFGAFQPAKSIHQEQPETAYKPDPTIKKAASHYNKWRKSMDAFKPVKTDKINKQREAHEQVRKDLRAQQKAKLEKIRSDTNGQERVVAVSVAKMEQSIALAALADQLAHDRHALRRLLAEQVPGNTFRDYLVNEASKGDNDALSLARKYGIDEATDVLRKREVDQLQIVAAATGQEYTPAPRINFTHHVERNGTVVFNLGHGRIVTDSAVSKQIQLNSAAATDPESIATSLRFATAKFGNTLTLTGSAEFQLLAVETTVLKGLGVKFADPALDAYREKFLLAQQQQSKEPTKLKEKQNASNVRDQHTHRTPPAHLRHRVLDLSSRDLVLYGDRNERVLREDVHVRVERPEEKQNQDLQLTAGRTAGTGNTENVGAHISGTANTGRHFVGGNIPGRVFSPGATTGTSLGIVRTGGARERPGAPGERVDFPVASTSSLNPQAQRAAAPAAEINNSDLDQEPVKQVEASQQVDVSVGQLVFDHPKKPSEKEWLAANGKDTKDQIKGKGQGDGKVLYITQDGRCIQSRDRFQKTYAISSVPNFEINVGDLVRLDKQGAVQLIVKDLGQSKGR
ncbi:MAG: TraI/MobA(P) family conjugative relaxase [Sulfuricella sp.]